jgi:hypothetical protein
MRQLHSPRVIYLKAFLFLCCAVLAATILIIDHPGARTILLLAIAVWCFARFYYFAFYVIERYVDPRFHFTGMIAMLKYFLRGRKI